MKNKLISTIGEIINLLMECNNQDRALWFEEKLNIIEKSSEDSEEFISAIKTIKSILVGMGSFTDLSLIPRKGSKLTIKEARIKKFDLAEKIDTIIIEFLKG